MGRARSSRARLGVFSLFGATPRRKPARPARRRRASDQRSAFSLFAGRDYHAHGQTYVSRRRGRFQYLRAGGVALRIYAVSAAERRVCSAHGADNYAALLQNNLARFLYSLYSGRAFPVLPVALEADDRDECINRAQLARRLSRVDAAGNPLKPEFLHLIVNLYYGTFGESRSARKFAIVEALHLAPLRLDERGGLANLYKRTVNEQLARCALSGEGDRSAHSPPTLELRIRGRIGGDAEHGSDVSSDALVALVRAFCRNPRLFKRYPQLRFAEETGHGNGPALEALHAVADAYLAHSGALCCVSSANGMLALRPDTDWPCTRACAACVDSDGRQRMQPEEIDALYGARLPATRHTPSGGFCWLDVVRRHCLAPTSFDVLFFETLRQEMALENGALSRVLEPELLALVFKSFNWQATKAHAFAAHSDPRLAQFYYVFGDQGSRDFSYVKPATVKFARAASNAFDDSYQMRSSALQDAANKLNGAALTAAVRYVYGGASYGELYAMRDACDDVDSVRYAIVNSIIVVNSISVTNHPLGTDVQEAISQLMALFEEAKLTDQITFEPRDAYAWTIHVDSESWSTLATAVLSAAREQYRALNRDKPEAERAEFSAPNMLQTFSMAANLLARHAAEQQSYVSLLLYILDADLPTLRRWLHTVTASESLPLALLLRARREHDVAGALAELRSVLTAMFPLSFEALYSKQWALCVRVPVQHIDAYRNARFACSERSQISVYFNDFDYPHTEARVRLSAAQTCSRRLKLEPGLDRAAMARHMELLTQSSSYYGLA